MEPARDAAVLPWAALRWAAAPDVDVVDRWVPAALATAAPPPASEPARARVIRSLRIGFHLLSGGHHPVAPYETCDELIRVG
jgi:hypothetical protein